MARADEEEQLEGPAGRTRGLHRSKQFGPCWALHGLTAT
jgi:hypothetical protein